MELFWKTEKYERDIQKNKLNNRSNNNPMFLCAKWSTILFEGPDCHDEDKDKFYFYWNVYFVKLSYMPYNLRYNYKVRWPECQYQVGYGNKNITSDQGNIEVYKYAINKVGGELTDVTDSFEENGDTYPSEPGSIYDDDHSITTEEYKKRLNTEYDKIYKYAIENPGSNFLTRYLYDDGIDADIQDLYASQINDDNFI